MSLRLLEYMLAIKKRGNITEAAKELFITPSALNQQLLKLERELGAQLFHRSPRRLVPTAAGRVYLEKAAQILLLQQEAYSEIQDLTNCATGNYRIGLTYDHGSRVFARIYPLFHQRYPRVTMRCYQLLSPELLKMLLNGDLDMAFLLSGTASWNDIDYTPLSSENLLLGLPRGHPLARAAKGDGPGPAPDLTQLADDRFALTLENSTMRVQLINPLFEAAGFAPNIMVESSFNTFLEQLTAEGFCDTIIPQSRISNREDIAWFYLPGAPRFHFGAGTMRGYRLNAALRYFLDLARADAREHLDFAPPEG